jgi:hypothetical protein
MLKQKAMKPEKLDLGFMVFESRPGPPAGLGPAKL